MEWEQFEKKLRNEVEKDLKKKDNSIIKEIRKEVSKTFGKALKTGESILRYGMDKR